MTGQETPTVPTRRQLLDALKAGDKPTVTRILTQLHEELGDDRFSDLLMDLWGHHADAFATFRSLTGEDAERAK